MYAGRRNPLPPGGFCHPVPASTSIPPAFRDRLSRIVQPESLDSVMASFSGPRSGSFRVNRLLDPAGDVVDRIRAEGLHPEPVGFCEDGWIVPPDERDRLGSLRATAEHEIWLQNPSSMVPPVVLAPEPGERVLDLAAAPGSKTLQMAALMDRRGELAAVEIVKPRFFRLRRNLDAAGASFVRTYLQDGMKAWRYRPDHFDRVLLDAPCSTEGRFRADDPETFAYWSESKIREQARKQKRLLESALRCVQPGGIVVYSTCSFAPEENEAVVQHALARMDVVVEPISVPLPGIQQGLVEWDGTTFDDSIRNTVRVLPDGVFEGFYVARLRRLA